MKRTRILIAAAVLGLMLGLQVGLNLAQDAAPQAALGTAFTYQGRLADGGAAANGQYDLLFRLYAGLTGGTALGEVMLNDVPVSEGLFTVSLSFGSGAFNGEARFLEVGVRPGPSSGAFTTLSPRQALTPAPYALALPGLWTSLPR